jgi:hypothetical protein
VKRALADLGRNLVSGLRLAFALPVGLLDFRISIRQFVLLVAIDILCSIGTDYLHAGPEPVFSLQAVVYEGFIIAVLLLIAVLLAAAFRQRHLRLALPVIVLASEPAIDVLGLMLTLPGAQGFGAQFAGFWVSILWSAFIYWRAVAVALAPGRPRRALRAFAGAVLLMLAVPIGIWAYQPWWHEAYRPLAEDPSYPSPVSEAALAAQQTLLSDALDDLEDERENQTDLYFIGFAPYASEDVFRKDMVVAKDLFDDRFDTDGRSIVLINNPRTVLDEPLATVSNLRETLKEIGDTIDPDDDVVMLYLEGHGTRDFTLAAEYPPLRLDSLTPQMLRGMLDDSGIKWRIIVVSACYSGGWIDALKDDHTLIMTASAANRTSFGCGNESNATYFGDALFQHALRFEDSFVKAFEDARARIAERERAEAVSPPSDPQLFVGEAMAQKLPSLEAVLRSRRTGSTI